MVQCRNCGFLCLRNVSSQELSGVPVHGRETGEVSKAYDQNALCFVMAQPIQEEVVPGDGESRKKQFLQIINKERNCQDFYDWMQGYSPKEHRERRDMDRLREWQRQAEKEDREYRDEQRRQDNAYRDGQDRWARRQFWLTFTIGMILIPILAALLQTASAWLQPNQYQSQTGPQPTIIQPPTKTPIP